jgi:hypothetical protein
LLSSIGRLAAKKLPPCTSLVETSRGWRIAKEKAAHKIDVVIALAMAAHAAMTRQWDEESKIVQPFFAGTPRNIPAQNYGVGASERAPMPDAPPPISNYDYDRERAGVIMCCPTARSARRLSAAGEGGGDPFKNDEARQIKAAALEPGGGDGPCSG